MSEKFDAGRTGRPLEVLRPSGLDAPIFAQDDPRWRRLDAQPAPAIGLRDSFRGTLVGGATGDAMGRPNEGIWPSEARARRLREYQPWQGWTNGTNGAITDDTQMTMGLAEAILAAGGTGHGARGRRHGGTASE